MQQEHRSVERARTFLRAQIMFNNRMTTIDCIIKNYSAAGAKIALNDTLAVPNEFDLVIPAKQRSHRARLIWRDKDSIGVNFAAAAPRPEEFVAKPQHADGEFSAMRMRELEVQNAELKVQIRALRKRLEDLGQDPNLVA